MAENFTKAAVTVVQRRTPAASTAAPAGSPANKAATPTPKAPAKEKPAKPAPVRPAVQAPTGELKDVIAAAEQALNPSFKQLSEFGAHSKAKAHESAQAIEASIREMIAKARVGVSGPSPALEAAAETLRGATASLAEVEAKLAEHGTEVVATATELLGLRAKNAELTARDKAVKGDGARRAGMIGRAAKLEGDAKTEADGKVAALTTNIATEKAAIAAERELHGDKLATADAEFERHSNETAGFGAIVQHVEDRIRLTAEHAAAFAEHERHAADGPGLKDRLATAVAAYKTRIEELIQAK